MRWKFHPRASEEYLDACRYYAEIEARLGAAFVRNVEAAVDEILRHPLAWPAIEEDVHRRFLKRFPYAIYYTVEDDLVLIVAVMHMKRRPGSWHERLPE